MSDKPEWKHVESPFIDQLQSMKWKFTTGNEVAHPRKGHRSSYLRRKFPCNTAISPKTSPGPMCRMNSPSMRF